jgi:hypothetical protein
VTIEAEEMRLVEQKVLTLEKAQQDPQLPWFFTGLTIPWSLQSKLAGYRTLAFKPKSSLVLIGIPFLCRSAGMIRPWVYAFISSGVMSVNRLTPKV